TVVRKQYNKLRTGLPRLFNIGAHIILADTERPFRHQPARIGDRRIGKGLPEYRDPQPAFLEQLHRLERRTNPFGIANVVSQKRIVERLDQLFHPRFAIGEFPMAGHGVRLEQRHAIDHVLAFAAVRAERSLPGIATIEEKDLLVAAFAAHVFDHRSQPIEPADAAIGFRQSCKIQVRQGIGRCGFLRDAEASEKIHARKMRRLPPRFADSEIDRRLTKVDREELAMDVSDMQQHDIAERIKPEKLRFTQVLLRDGAYERAVASRESRGSNADVKNFTASNHQSPSRSFRGMPPRGAPAGRAMKQKARGHCEPRQCLMPGTLSFCPSFCVARYNSRSPY